ncbi:hypothetical protein R5R35_010032 [Gryllus longicercus]|uniref:Cytidine deaminase n=1 Tax=Gryllus longicercus TaxID=2509291 RepID=A0AAN9ZCL0_9ORTH
MASELNSYGFPDGSEIKTNSLVPEIKKLVEDSAKARDLAYCPYSKFNVGAALLAENGAVYTGCNVECSSYGGTVCAERTAAVKAISEGIRKFKAIAVIASNVRDFTAPCGICRQFLLEFGDISIFIVKSDLSSVKVYQLSSLLPEYFLF